MRNSKIASGKEVRAHPTHPMGFFWPRTEESARVENTSYVLASERPHSD